MKLIVLPSTQWYNIIIAHNSWDRMISDSKYSLSTCTFPQFAMHNNNFILVNITQLVCLSSTFIDDYGGQR